MSDKELNISYTNVCQFLADRKLKPVFDLLEKVIGNYNLEFYRDEWRNLDQTYHFMLKYTVEGIQDPERQRIYRKLVVSVYGLADKIYGAAKLKVSSAAEYERKRSAQNQEKIDFSDSLQQLEDFYVQKELISLVDGNEVKTESNSEDTLNHHQGMVLIFNYVWLKDEMSDGEIDFLNRFFSSELIEIPYKSFMVSALVLSLQRHFDEKKFSLLFDLYNQQNTEINQRALVGLLLGFFKYDSRMPFYPELTGRLHILNENQEFKRNVEGVIIQLIRSRETEKIQQKIKDEIIPEMIRISPTLKDKINLEGLMGEGSEDDKNPEWQEIFKDSPGLMDKMEEFSELQMEGADVFMGSFAMLKMYPFFSEFTNWFMPFFIQNPQIAHLADSIDETYRWFIDALNNAPILCNSDKYSFCFSLQNLPKENREFMAQGMNAEMNQFREMLRDEELTEPGKKSGYVSNQYIQDLYRFYKLHQRKKDFEDVFKWRFDFHNKISFGKILIEDEKLLRNIGEYYFKKNYFDEAAEIFERLLKGEKDGELYQKLGFCYQKSGNYERALEAYQKAEYFGLNKLWNLKKIALCYRSLKKPKKALEYYLEVDKLNEQDLSTELNIGHCYLELEQFEEALKYYFKVEYLAPGNKKVWRPLGWCSFVTGKKEQAAKYFQQLIDDEPAKHDLMNMGHVQWSLGNRKAALDYYKKSISKDYFTEKEFFEVFDEDLRHLVDQGIEKEDVPIMLDQLRYFVESPL